MKKIKEICELQKKIYVLQEVKRREWEISRYLEDAVPRPIEPREIKYSYKDIPDYDEEKYVKLAKANGAGLGEFRMGALQAGLMLAGTVIGLLICWIPLLLCLLSWPYSIYNTRKKAYKLYVEDCKKLENQNECNRIEVEQYNRAYAKYQNDLQLYQSYQNHANARSKVFEREFCLIDNELSDLTKKYNMLCTEADIAPIHRDFASINSICSYINKGQANSVREAIQTFQYQVSSGRITTNIEYIKKNYSFYKDSMPEVVKALKECSSYVDYIEKDLIKCIKTVTDESDNMKDSCLRKYISNESI